MLANVGRLLLPIIGTSSCLVVPSPFEGEDIDVAGRGEMMNGESDLRYTISNKRQLEAEEDSGTNSDLTEKHSSDVRQIPMVTSTKRMKNIEKEHEDTVSRSSSSPLECPSSQFPYLNTQEQLKKIFETRRFRNLKEKFNFQDSDDSDEEEEQNSIKTDHDHRQYELTMKAIRETLLKKPDD